MSPQGLTLASAVVEKMSRTAGAARWGLTTEEFVDALEASVDRAFRDREPDPRDLRRYLDGLHLADLALATACALGRDAAWDHFVVEHRPILYRTADALDPSGGARELADSLYADLYGMREDSAGRRSLFRYFHGRSSLAAWLRAVLAQRHVDAMRAHRRVDPLPEDEGVLPAPAEPSPDPDRLALVPQVEAALLAATAQLAAKDRLRLRSYYVLRLTLAEIGRITAEHEATVSRQLARTRRGLRDAIEQHLREVARLDDRQIARALELAIDDPGGMDLQQLLALDRKESSRDRSR